MELRLKEIRRIRKLTQHEVADSIGCTVGAYSKYETGDREPSITVLNRLADFYGVSVDYLLGRDVTDVKALTEYEQELIDASRNSSAWVRSCVIEIIKVINGTCDK